MTEPRNEPWRVERKVPVAIIITLALQLVVQLVAAAWWASNTSARLTAVETQITAAAPQAVSIAKLETKVDGVVASISEIKDILRRQQPVR